MHLKENERLNERITELIEKADQMSEEFRSRIFIAIAKEYVCYVLDQQEKKAA